MCSDPWPGGDQEAITKWLNALCRKNGFIDWTMAYHEMDGAKPATAAEAAAPRCRVCGCTDDDCRLCIERTGEPCHWTEPDLCSACAAELSR